LRGAISGFGEVAAAAHLAGWRTRPEVVLVAIHDPVSERRHSAMNLVRNARVYDDLDLMLDGEALDFVDIASPPAFHGAAVRKALEAGANVLVEKPLCLSTTEFEELAALAARKSRILMCVHNWKHAPSYRRAHDLIESGRLGDLRFISRTDIPIDSVTVNPNLPAQVYAGTDFGLYFTDDITATPPVWQRFSSGVPAVMIWDMQVDRGATTLSLWSRGRGAFVWPLPTTP